MKPLVKVFVVILLAVFSGGTASAKIEYAEKTGLDCTACHRTEEGGGLNITGLAFIRGGYQYPIPDRVRQKTVLVDSSTHRIIHLILGYVHLVFAVIFCGAIFYIHIFIKPASLKGGIPKAERRLGLSSMGVLTFSGAYLTWYRVDSLSTLTQSHFGRFLLLKIGLFILMVSLGLAAVLFISRKIKRLNLDKTTGLTPRAGRGVQDSKDTLSGKTGFILYKGKRFDVSGSEHWKGGVHYKRHYAGSDLTQAMEAAPHGPDVLERLPHILERSTASEQKSLDSERARTNKIFVILAYINLGLIFLILACIALWRWGESLL